jgi:peptidoglycan/xylan/chitin deacetylase (PgdA/CDA1 family)
LKGCPLIILTWHSISVLGNDYADNDPLAFREDIQSLDRNGWRIAPLSEALGRLEAGKLDQPTAVLTVDDGSILDFEDFDHPSCGPQTSLYHSLRDFGNSSSISVPHRLHLSAFVIASPEARSELDRRDYMSLNVWPDHWWSAANRTGLLSIESHSWDHNHGSLERTAQRDNQRGDFRLIETEPECRIEIDQASDYIEQRAGRRPEFFAYPYGQASDYLRKVYFPEHADRLGIRAALGCDPEPVTAASDRWFLPRFMCGRDWKQPGELQQILRNAARPI